jgi:cytochrome b subunit of formate dehydrogenase
VSRIVRETVGAGKMAEQRVAVVRFDASQRLEHVVTVLSTVVLALTGLVQKFYDAGISQSIVSAFGGLGNVRTVHHAFAIMLTVGAIYHVARVAYSILGKRSPLSMLPNWKDFTDAITMVKYFFGLAKEQPQFDRYNYGEKVEYWAMVWGTALMAFTGYILWFPTRSAVVIDGLWIEAAKAAHGGEAILAVLSLLVWHTYHVHFKSLNASMLHGKLSEKHMLEEHPLEYARLLAAEKAAGKASPKVAK